MNDTLVFLNSYTLGNKPTLYIIHKLQIPHALINWVLISDLVLAAIV